MLQARERLTEAVPAQATLTMTFDERRHSRLRARLDDGREIALFLPRGTVLRNGDLIRTEDGLVVEVRAASEVVSTATTRDARLLTRVAYHLGNRHILLEIGPGWVRYQHDHVLDEMVAGMKCSVRIGKSPFEPEAGPYHGGGKGHGHGHTPDHTHDHAHDHAHDHSHDHAHAHSHDHGHDHAHGDHDHKHDHDDHT